MFDYAPNATGININVGFVSNDTSLWENVIATVTVTVTLRTTTTAISCSPTAVVVNETFSCTVEVIDVGATGTKSSPEGTITIGQTSGSGTTTPCVLASSSSDRSTCTFGYKPTNVGNRFITASYPANGPHAASGFDVDNNTGKSALITVTRRQTEINLQCSETPLVVNEKTQCFVSVVDISPGEMSVPTGPVTFETSVPSEGSFSSTTCTLDLGGFCGTEVVYTALNADTTTHMLTATFCSTSSTTSPCVISGKDDAIHDGSDDTFSQDIEKRELELLLNCPQVELFINEAMTCTVTISDDTTAGSALSTFPGTLTIDNTVNGDDDEISSDNCTTIPSPPSGSCTFTYTPKDGDAGTASISVSYTSPGTGVVYSTTSAAVVPLTVKLRTTVTTVVCRDEDGNDNPLFVNESGSCTVRITDTATGTAITPVIISLSKSTTGSPATLGSTGCGQASLGVEQCVFSYTVDMILNPDVTRIDVITAAYAASTTHATSVGAFAMSISRRLTVTTITCVVRACHASVSEAAANRGTAMSITGSILNVATTATNWCVLTSGLTAMCDFTVPDSSVVMVNVTGRYVATNQRHFDSVGGTNITDASGVPTTGPGGASDVQTAIEGLNAACLAASIAATVLDATAISLTTVPSPLVGGGIGVITGATIPAAEWGQFFAGIAKIVLEVYNLTACTDLDGDGIPGILELTVTTTSDTNPDDDGDGMGDGDEVSNASGFFGGTACPNPTISDSDGDGLKDGWEATNYQTAFCVADTDFDGVVDGVEIATIVSPTDAGFDATWLTLADVVSIGAANFPFAIKDQINALIPDTDGDGLKDDLELNPGCNGGSDGFANDDDSDDDGVQDGFEAAQPVSGTTAGSDLGTASGNDGELGTDTLDSICDPDSDDDGLLDGVERFLGTKFDDWDTDDDGLSDWEELEFYFTNPNNVDTDGDEAGNAPTSGTTNLIDDRPTVFKPASASNVAVAGTVVCLSDCEEALSGTTLGEFTGEIRDETDPLQSDTDGDGIRDDIEFNPGCNMGGGGIGTGTAFNDGFANSFDSDGDGASDGVEAGVAGILAGMDLATIGGDVPNASGNDGELNDDGISSICDPDSDGDGLLDGEELGKSLGSISKGSLLGFLDWDSDDDGLSDAEELLIYFTDPQLADTDSDNAQGVIEFRLKAFFDTSHPLLPGYTGSDTILCESDCEEVFSGTLLFNTPNPAIGPPGLVGFGNPLDETDPLQVDTDGDGINDDVEFNPGCNEGTGGPGTGTALFDGFANSFDSDADGLRDFEDAVADVFDGGPGNNDTPVTRGWETYPETATPAPGDPVGKLPGADGVNDGEINDDAITGICDPDSDGDGILDGEEHQIGTDPYDHDTDDDGRGDGEFLGQGPIPSDPLDFDTDDDGIGDGVEVFASSATNPVNADTDGDGLCDGGSTTPASNQFAGGVDGAGTNPLCFTGVASHPNNGGAVVTTGSATPAGFGEDVNGNGLLAEVGVSETNPNDFDTDNDGLGDGVEVLAFFTSRQGFIPSADLFGRPILVVYPEQNSTIGAFPNTVLNLGVDACLNPLNPDTDGDGLSDGDEDTNLDGVFNFERGDFDHAGTGPIPGPAQDNPEETNPCDPDTDHDGLNDFLERNQPNLPQGSTTAPQSFFPFNPTNPLDHDTDNDHMLDGEEVSFICPAAPLVTQLDNDNDGAFDEDPIDGVDNDGDGLIDEDPPDFIIFHVSFLDPTNRDTDGDGFLDGLDPGGFGGPCNTALIVVVPPISTIGATVDIDNDGFADDDEVAAGTDPNNPDSHPEPFFADLDLGEHSITFSETLIVTLGDSDEGNDDRMWLDDLDQDGIAESVVIDLNADGLVDARVQIILPRDMQEGDFDADGEADDRRYTVIYAFANARFLHPRIIAVIYDYNGDGTIDRIELSVP